MIDVILGGDPQEFDFDSFQSWTRGLTIQETARRRCAAFLNSEITERPAIGETEPETMPSLFFRDTADQWRAFEALEHFLQQPDLLRSQSTLCRLPSSYRAMIQEYYSLDAAVVREIMGRKITSKARKDLGETTDLALTG